MIKKILIIDDDFSVAEMLKDQLELEGYSVFSAYCGSEGVKKARQLLPNLIFLDVAMPDMDGFQVMELLKKEKETKDIPVLLISAVENFKDRGIQVGAFDFIPKPINFNKLYDTLNSLNTGGGVPDGVKLLIIDDDEATCELIKEWALRQNYNCEYISKPDNIIPQIKKIRPDLILLDWRLPGQDAAEIIREVRTDEQLRNIKIIIITSYLADRNFLTLSNKQGFIMPEEIVRQIRVLKTNDKKNTDH